MADTTTFMHRPSSMAEIQRHAKRLVYLGTTDKILNALAYEYGPDRKLPSRRFVQELLDDRRARPYARRVAA